MGVPFEDLHPIFSLMVLVEVEEVEDEVYMRVRCLIDFESRYGVLLLYALYVHMLPNRIVSVVLVVSTLHEIKPVEVGVLLVHWLFRIVVNPSPVEFVLFMRRVDPSICLLLTP